MYTVIHTVTGCDQWVREEVTHTFRTAHEVEQFIDSIDSYDEYEVFHRGYDEDTYIDV